jgi:hypothetical protein
MVGGASVNDFQLAPIKVFLCGPDMPAICSAFADRARYQVVGCVATWADAAREMETVSPDLVVVEGSVVLPQVFQDYLTQLAGATSIRVVFVVPDEKAGEEKWTPQEVAKIDSIGGDALRIWLAPVAWEKVAEGTYSLFTERPLTLEESLMAEELKKILFGDEDEEARSIYREALSTFPNRNIPDDVFVLLTRIEREGRVVGNEGDFVRKLGFDEGRGILVQRPGDGWGNREEIFYIETAEEDVERHVVAPSQYIADSLRACFREMDESLLPLARRMFRTSRLTDDRRQWLAGKKLLTAILELYLKRLRVVVSFGKDDLEMWSLEDLSKTDL